MTTQENQITRRKFIRDISLLALGISATPILNSCKYRGFEKGKLNNQTFIYRGSNNIFSPTYLKVFDNEGRILFDVRKSYLSENFGESRIDLFIKYDHEGNIKEEIKRNSGIININGKIIEYNSRTKPIQYYEIGKEIQQRFNEVDSILQTYVNQLKK